MSSRVEIFNLAATEIGTSARVTDPDEETVLARAVRGVWDTQRRAALREGSFNCAAARAELAALVGSVPYPFTMAYQLPADCLRLIEVLDEDARDAYQLEGRTILCDAAAPLHIRYVRDLTEAAEFDEAFADSFAKRIAATIGRKIAGSTFDQDDAWRKYRTSLAAAKRVDALENPPIEQEESDWITARLGGAVDDPSRLGGGS